MNYDLRVPSSNALGKLFGDRKGGWNIRTNEQWRNCIRLAAGNAHDVVVVDDHQEKTMAIRIEATTKTDLSGVLARPRKRLSVTHPGEFLRVDFMEPHGLTANALANALHVSAKRISAILKGQRGITADTALRLARYFGNTADFWLSLQKDFALRQARESAQGEIDSLFMPLVA